MSLSYGLGVESRDLRGCFGLADGGFGLLGEEGAVALGVGVALGNGGCDARCAGARGSVRCIRIYWSGCALGAAGAMRGEALGCLLFQSERNGFRLGLGFVQW